MIMINPEMRRKHKLNNKYMKAIHITVDNNNEIFEHGPCLICGKADASKTNSHLVPSFLVSMYSSYDNSGKRDKDLQFTITNTSRSVYVGAIPDIKYEETFNPESLKDENLLNDIKQNPDATDYVLCPKCEKLLAEYLEAPYAISINQKKDIDGDIAYFFWLSIVWRMDACGKPFGFNLDQTTSSRIHDMLSSFFERRKGSATPPINSETFKYKLLYCPDYCKKTKAGFQYCNYKEGVLTFIIADFIMIAYFDGANKLPTSYMFECLRNEIEEAETNEGKKNERKHVIIINTMKAAVKTFIQINANNKKNEYVNLINRLWREFNISGEPSENFINDVICDIFSDETKLAERETINSLATAIMNNMRKYNIKLPNHLIF